MGSKGQRTEVRQRQRVRASRSRCTGRPPICAICAGVAIVSEQPVSLEGVVERLSISPELFGYGIQLFAQYEPRDVMYRVASYLLSDGVWWGDFGKMADALSVVLLTWNSAFYRFGTFDAAKVEDCLRENHNIIDHFHKRDIEALGEADRVGLRTLFLGMLEATRIVTSNGKDRRSPVSVAKALHLLAPHALPIWDSAIAQAYRCNYAADPAQAYWRFCLITKEVARRLRPHAPPSDSSLLKHIDEYNFARYTRANTWPWDGPAVPGR